MALADAPQDAAPRKRSKLPLLLGAGLALTLGGGGFAITYTGLLFGGADPAHEAGDPMPPVAFVPIDPVIVNLAPGGANRHLRFSAQMEVAKGNQAEVVQLMPRILDVMNGYLRAVEPGDLEAQNALVVLRAQLLRRIQMVAGEGRVRDLLVTEFVLN